MLVDTEPDVLADAGTLLTRFTRGEILGQYDNGEDHIIVSASAILAVAAELRNIHNALADLTAILAAQRDERL